MPKNQIYNYFTLEKGLSVVFFFIIWLKYIFNFHLLYILPYFHLFFKVIFSSFILIPKYLTVDNSKSSMFIGY